MEASSLCDAATIVEQLRTTHRLFADIRARFACGGRERGGQERIGYTPIYVRRFGEHARLFLQPADRYAVAASYSADQFAHIQVALVCLKRSIVGSENAPGFAERVVATYLRETQPFFLQALSTSALKLLTDTVECDPQHAVTFDAIFRVAGGEGMRDLVQLYGARMLEGAIAGASPAFPDLLAFVDLHDSYEQTAEGPLHTRSEVWCPGYDLAKAFLTATRQAAETLVREHGVRVALPLRDEVAVLPLDLVDTFNSHVATLAQATLARYGVEA